jgi:hypothetical protein
MFLDVVVRLLVVMGYMKIGVVGCQPESNRTNAIGSNFNEWWSGNIRVAGKGVKCELDPFTAV